MASLLYLGISIGLMVLVGTEVRHAFFTGLPAHCEQAASMETKIMSRMMAVTICQLVDCFISNLNFASALTEKLRRSAGWGGPPH